jgi:hypothetical protein
MRIQKFTAARKMKIMRYLCKRASTSRVVRALAVTCLLFPALFAASPRAFCQQGTITGTIAGTVVDSSGASIAYVQVKLSLDTSGVAQETLPAVDGNFSFTNVVPGPFHISFTAQGFADRTITGELHASEVLYLPRTALAVAGLTTQVNVTETQAEIAQKEIKVEEQQRFVGLVPNYFTSYNSDAVPLNTKQKFELTWKTFLDPSSFVINGAIAGVWQAHNTYKGFGQGAQGYGKRYGAGFADFGTGLVLSNVVLPGIFKQDPRYFYKGTGSVRSRFFYAISRSVICRGDNRKDQFCYSSVISNMGASALTNFYYPAADRNSAAENLELGAFSIGGDALSALFQEFIARKLMRKKR